MKRYLMKLNIMAAGLAVLLSLAGAAHGQVRSGQTAPLFSAKDLKGKTLDLAAMKGRPLTILYFFDAGSRPSQEGLLSLNQLARQHKADMSVWAITSSPANQVARFVSIAGPGFPVIAGASNVAGLYQARQVLPVVCVIGPGLRVLDYFQGGGKTTETMLVRVAERELQRRKTHVAQAIAGQVARKNPRNARARAVVGYAALRDSDLKKAEAVFTDLSRQEGDGEVLGKEGLAAVYRKRNQNDKALRLVREVEEKAPRRAYGHVIKGDILYERNRKKEAEAEYRKAVAKEEAEPYHDAVRYNQLGRYYSTVRKSSSAREMFARAEEIDPYYVEGTTNKGLSLEKEGRWGEALKAYQQALAVDSRDVYAGVLARRAQEMLDLEKDAKRKDRMDRLVKELAERFRSRKDEKPPEDSWTSRPTILTFVDFEEKGGLPEREGFGAVITSELTNRLNASGRVKVVERVLMERLLEELNIGSSELADPETALRLGKVLAARLIGTGTLTFLPQEAVFTFRLIDTETSEIPGLVTRQLGQQASLDREILSLNRDILKTVIEKYPLRGYVAKVSGGESIINIGSRHGVVAGTRFDVLDEAETLQYRGKTLRGSMKKAGQVEVVAVEQDFARVKPLGNMRRLKEDDKVQERLYETAAR
jgi:tetratricopeptide (TPR) repeat protein/peroxiredoxin